MALPTHVVHAPAGLGLDEATRPEHVPYGSANLRAENVRQTVRGELAKRNGFTALTNNHIDASLPDVSFGIKVFTDRNSIIRITDALTAEAYSTQAVGWSSLGRVPEATARIIDLPSMGVTTYQEDVDATNGYLAVSWTSIATGAVGSAYLAIIDQVTGSIVRPPEKVGTSTDIVPALLSVQGNYFVMVRFNSSGTTLDAFYLDTTSRATITTGWVAFGAALASDAFGAYVVHALPHASTPRIALLYSNTSGGTDQLTLKTFNVSGVVQTKTILTNSALPSAFALAGNPTDTLWLTWCESTTIRVRGVSPFTITSDLATVASLGTMATGCNLMGIAPSSVTGKARWWANDTATAKQARMRGVKTTAGAAAADGTETVVPGVRMCRKPMFYGSRYYGCFYNLDTNNGQSNFFVCDWSDDVSVIRPVANPAPGLASAGLAELGKFVAGTVSSTFCVAFGIKRSAIADGSALVELDFATENAKRWQTAAHGNATFLAGGVPSTFDGVRVAEVGFLYRPPTPTTATSGAGITCSTGWRYVAVYEETDSDGNWHVSGLSNPSASTGAVTNKTVTVTTRPLAITSRLTSSGSNVRGVRVAWYRTADGGVAPYYRLGVTTNDPTALTVTYTDVTPDATLIAASKLYAQPGVLGTAQDRRPPPAFSNIVSYNGMLVGASGSDVWFSGQNVSGEGTWFNPVFQVPIPGDDDITALAVMDGTLFAFKRSEVYSLVGDPPSDNGAAGGLGTPRRVASDVGARKNSGTTCTTSLGVFFQSERGIEILTRAQAVEWIGEPVQTTEAAYSYCSAMTVDPISNVLLVELSSGLTDGLSTGTGRTLVYDLNLRTWVSVDRRKSFYGITDVPAQSACMVYTGTVWRYAWIAADGLVSYENTASSLDQGQYWVTSLYETAYAKHGLQQDQRTWSAMLLFEHTSAANLKVEIAYDYAAYSSSDDKTWTEAETLSKLQLEFKPKFRGQALKFRISDSAPAVLATGRGLTFIGLSIDTAPKQGITVGTPRLPPSLRK